MSALLIELLKLFIIFQLVSAKIKSIFEEDHSTQRCIKKNEDELFCISLYLLTLESIDISSVYVTMTDDPNQPKYESGHLPLSSISSASNCFLYKNTNSVYVQIFDAKTNTAIGNVISIQMTYNTSTTTYAARGLKATFSIWIGEYQCLEIHTGDMFINDTFIINISFYRIGSLQMSAAKYNTVSSSTRNIHLSRSNTASWYSMICLSGSPMTANLDYVAADISITSYWTQYSYNLLNMNRFESVSYLTYSGADGIIGYFGVGNIFVKYWQSCSISCNELFGWCWDKEQYTLLQIKFPIYVFVILLIIFIMIILMIMVARYGTAHRYCLLSSTLDYRGLLWLMIELWDWCTDLCFVVFLYLNVSIITEERVSGLLLLLLFGVVCLVATYIINMVYMTHYLQMWSSSAAPGITRLWLQEWSWFLISISMTFGGVHVALEFCNSLITPNINIFAMHIPHSEMVRTRKDRFITNVLCQNMPFIIIYILYLIKMKSQPNITAYLGVITSVLSIILSLFWALYRRGYGQQHPLALYSVQIYFKTERWKQYYIHCHNRICTALQNGLNVRKSNLIILDQCSESYESMKIEARILKDTKVFGYKLPSISNDTAQQILNCLIQEFKQEFELKNFHAEHVNYGEGEYVYNHNTGVLALCNAIKGCFCPQQTMVTTPPRPRKANISDEQPFKHNKYHETVSSLSNASEWGLDFNSKIKNNSTQIAGNAQSYDFERETPVFK